MVAPARLKGFLAACAAMLAATPGLPAPGRPETRPQTLQATLTVAGLTLLSPEGTEPPWSLGLTLSNVRRAEGEGFASRPGGPSLEAGPEALAHRGIRTLDDGIEYDFGAITVTLASSARGQSLEFLLSRPPARVIEGEGESESGELHLDLDLTADPAPRFEEGVGAIRFVSLEGHAVARASLLEGRDAGGAVLPARLELVAQERGRPDLLRVIVDDSGAVYPILVVLLIEPATPKGAIDGWAAAPGSALRAWGNQTDAPARDVSSLLAPPPNDQCSGAELIPAGGPFPYLTSVTADITMATTTGDPVVPGTCTAIPGETISRSLWYKFTPTVSANYTIASCADAPAATTAADTLIAVYTSTGGCAGVLSLLAGACNDDGCTVEDFQAVTTASLAGGTTYYIVVWHVGASAPTAGHTAIQLRINPPPPPPPNDPCAGAIAIPSTGPFPFLTTAADTTSATSAGDPALCQPASHTIWYTFTPAVTAAFGITSCQIQAPGTTLVDSVIGVFTSASGCSGPFASIACGDQDPNCSGGSNRSRMTPVLVAGTTYYIVAGSFGSGTPNPASLQLAISAPPAGDTCAAPVPIVLDRPVSGSTYPSTDDYELSDPACFSGAGQTVSTAAGGEVVYGFQAPVAGSYSFRVTNYFSGSSSNVVLYVSSACPAPTPLAPVTVGGCLGAANRTVVPLDASNTNTSEEVSCISLAASATAYVYVDDHSALATGSPFRVEVNRCAPEAEPNGIPALANALACPIEGAISPAADADYFALGAPLAGSRVFALADGVAANSNNLSMRVTTASDTLEYDDDDADLPFGQRAPTVEGTPLTGSAAYLRLDHSSAATQTRPYRLYAALQPSIGFSTLETEPNGTTGQANVSATNYFSGALAGPAPSTDIDLFRFSALAGSLVYLGLDADPLRNNTPINAALSLLDFSGATLASVNDASSTSDTTSGAGSLTSLTPRAPAEGLVFRATATGAYYAKVTIGTSSTGATGAGDYLLSIALDCLARDTDGDGAADGEDCRPADASLWSAPGPAQGLMLSGAGATTLSWALPGAPGGGAVRYDLLRSVSPRDFSTGTTCLASNTVLQSATDTNPPQPLFCYLVRSRNVCGSTLGSDSTGAPRSGRSCP